MNYESMTDRELDALVAEKVMGATLCEDGFYEWHNSEFASYEAPNYATSIRGAFQVVEAMRERGLWFEIETTAQGWHVVTGVEPGCTGEEAEDESLPRAICIAALRAIDA